MNDITGPALSRHDQDRSLIVHLWGFDKHCHILLSCIILLVLAQIVPVSVSILITAALGFLKEAWDGHWGSGFCWIDIVANKIGMALGLVIYFF